jgi:hypothetical protein
MHAVAIELDFVQPRWPLRRCVDELGELRRDPVRQTGLLGGLRATPRAMPGATEQLRRRRMRPVDSCSAYPSATARRAPTVRAAS